MLRGKRNDPVKYGAIAGESSFAADKIFEGAEPVRLTWKGITIQSEPETSILSWIRKESQSQEPGKIILQNVSGIAEPGCMMAIMGSSGAGKSTLLNALTWRNQQNLRIEGEIKVNGHQLKEQIANISAYVQQDDLFAGALTVREHLSFYAKLRIDSAVNEADRTARVEKVVDQMGLRECQHTVIGTPGRSKTISGGERKRLSIASELLTNPPLLFCDEPTTGLDSYLAKTLCDYLRAVAEQGCTVLCTIHQPSSEVFEQFDQLLLLALGKVIYFGPREEATSYYSNLGMPCPQNFNPADHYIMNTSVVPGDEERCKKKIASLAENYELSDQHARTQSEIDERLENPYQADEFQLKSSRYKVGQFQQFAACLGRTMITTYRDPLVFRTSLAQRIVLGLIFGLVYLRTPFGKPYATSDIQNISGALFLVLIDISFSCVLGVSDAFSHEIILVRREHFNGMYSTAAYFLSKNVAELPMHIVFPLIFDMIVYFMMGFYPGASQFFVFYGICVLLRNTCVSFGYMLSCLSPSVTVALAIASPAIVLFFLLGGFFLSASSIPVYFVWLKYLSWYLYTNEMLTVNQWQSVLKLECSPVNGTTPATCSHDTGLAVIKEFDFSPENVYRDVGLMFVLLIGYRLIAFLGLLYRMRDSSR